MEKTIEELQKENQILRKIISRRQIPICPLCNSFVENSEEKVVIIYKAPNYQSTKQLVSLHFKCYIKQEYENAKLIKEIKKALKKEDCNHGKK